MASVNASALSARVDELEAALAALAAEKAALAAENEQLRAAYQQLRLELELLRRRLFVAKAERIDTAQLELEFMEKLRQLDRVGAALAAAAAATGDEPPPSPPPTGAPPAARRRRPTGRRDLREEDLPEERVEVPDPTREGKDERNGFEESARVVWRRGGPIRLITARVKYRTPVPKPDSSPTAAAPAADAPAADESVIVTAPMPPTAMPRCLAGPSLIAHIASDKFCDGLPLYRQEDRLARLGLRLDRGTMCRWLEEAGGILGATIVAAMRAEALATAFCLATDATGVLVQPPRGGDQVRRPCRRGHFFVQIADRDHVFFEYVPRETSAAVAELFRGFQGYVLADAKSVYDLLFRPPDERPPPQGGADADLAVRHEVGCWSHQRRKFWEAAITGKDPVSREGLARIMRMFQLERTWRKKPPDQRKTLRALHLRPHVDDFFVWAAAEHERVKDQRGLLRSALGYAVRQQGALCRFFDDGRLPMTNNESERQLRRVACGRKAWLFVGSDDHGQAAGNLLTLIASARLHGLDPELYLRDALRVLAQWPRERFIELAPKYWAKTRARLDPAQLEAEIGWLTVPPALPAPSPQEPPAR